MIKSVKSKIVLLGTGSAIITACLILALTLFVKYRMEVNTKEVLIREASKNLNTITKDIYEVVALEDKEINKHLNTNINIASDLIRRYGGINRSGATMALNVVNQFDKSSKTVNLNLLSVGPSVFNLNKSFNVATPIVDETSKLSLGTFTIFQKINNEGDMLRIATNVKATNGERAVGSFIPARMPDGSKNKVIESVLSDKKYIGSAFVVNAWYQTQYIPLKDKSGSIVGMLYSGIMQESDENIRSSIINKRVGKSGRLFVVGGKGVQKGKLIISENEADNGTNILENHDIDNKDYIKEMIEKTLNVPDGESVIISYKLLDKKTNEITNFQASAIYFKQWDWIIVANAYESELYESLNVFKSGMSTLIYSTILGSIVILLAVSLVSAIAGRNISNPIVKATTMAKELAKGNLHIFE